MQFSSNVTNVELVYFMDIYSSIKSRQNAKKIKELYNTIQLINNIERCDMNDFCVRSWDTICHHAPLSSLVIKMTADHCQIDWKDILSLQFYDQLYELKELNSKTKKRKISKYNGHCIGFACMNERNNIVNGQTWDVNPKYTDIELFEYPHAKTYTHPGIFGGAYISKHKYSVTWTGVETSVSVPGIPTPIFLFEAMNNIDIVTIKQFIDFEQKFEHAAAHSLSITDGDDVSYIERNVDSVSVRNNAMIPVIHSNTFNDTIYENNINDSYSVKRIKTMKSQIQSNKSMSKIYDVIKSNHIWINDPSWKTISAFIFDPKIDKIHFFDRNKETQILVY